MKFTTRDICQMSIFVAASAVLAQIVFPLPFSPVPISLGMLGAYASGIFLRPRCAFFAQVCYLLIGSAGLPVFHQFHGGVGVIAGPTGGYLLAYPIMALIVSTAVERGERVSPHKPAARSPRYSALIFASLSLATLVCYTLGTWRMMQVTNLPLAPVLSLAVYPFIPLDLLKITFSTFALLPLRGRVRGAAAALGE